MAEEEEYFDVLTKDGQRTGITKPRSQVHRDGDYHRAVHVWIYAESTGELLLQRRADLKDSWPGQWDISSAGHISAGDTSLITARRELQEELGVTLPSQAFELIFVYLQECVINNGTFINNEYNDVYLVTTTTPIPVGAFTLQESEVSMVKYIGWKEYKELLSKGDPAYVPYEVDGAYGQLFSIISQRYEPDVKERQILLQNKLARYKPVKLQESLAHLSEGDMKALSHIIQAAQVMDTIFLNQVWATNPALKAWLQQHREASELDNLKYLYYIINKSPWSVLDENESFLTTADSAVESASEAVKPVSGWEGLHYKAAFPVLKPLGCNFYPSDMDRTEFELWISRLDEKEKESATGFFTVIRRCEEEDIDVTSGNLSKACSLHIVPYSKEYSKFLDEAASLLKLAADVADTASLKKLLKAKAESFLSDDYFDSDVAWMELDSPIDLTIGPYETYEDGYFGYKATFESFIGLRDEDATSQVKLFSSYLQELENNLPLDDRYKSTSITASPIRVIRLIFNSGDVKGPQTVAFNLPNDERNIKAHGSAMVMLKNISEAKFSCILKPIAEVCISNSQQDFVDFNSFFTHTICHECCHGIGPHTITLSSGKQSTVRLELQELHSALEEAKADIVGMWALHYLIDKELLSRDLEESMYVSFLAGCFRSIRFGLEESHGKGQALQFNWILEKEGFKGHADGTFSVDFSKVRNAVTSLSREIMTIQAQGDKDAARKLLDKYGIMTPSLKNALSKLEQVEVPVDIFPSFEVLNQLQQQL